jgi:hypothetical protein
MRKLKVCWAEFFIGFGMGLGYLTSLRFMGPVGIPETFTLVGLFLLAIKNPHAPLKYSSRREYIFKSYILYSIFIVMPFITFISFFFITHIESSSPQYVISFMAGVLLMFYLADAIKKNSINMNLMVSLFYISFIFSNIIAIYFFGIQVGDDSETRYKGGAKNPNQLIFYAATLSLLIVVYLKKYSIFLLPIIAFIVFKAKSDAYNLMLFVVFLSYIFFWVCFKNKSSFLIQIFIASFSSLLFIIFIISIFGSEIKMLWLVADEGGARIDLISNSLKALAYSPFFGFGAGSFSGIVLPFQGAEAHNTFLDFALQFGILFPIFLYFIIFKALLTCLRRHEILVASFIVGFIVSGLFHFSARHFVFWVELAVLFNYAFYSKNLNFSLRRKLTLKPIKAEG